MRGRIDELFMKLEKQTWFFNRQKRRSLPDEEPPEAKEQVSRVLRVKVGVELGVQGLQKIDQQRKLQINGHVFGNKSLASVHRVTILTTLLI